MASDYETAMKSIITREETLVNARDAQSCECCAKGATKPKTTTPKSPKNQSDINSFLRLWWYCGQ